MEPSNDLPKLDIENGTQNQKDLAPKLQDLKSMPTAGKLQEVAGPNQRKFDRDLKTILRLYILPLLVITIFLLFLILGVIPNVQSIFGSLDKVNLVNEDTLKVEKDFEALKAMETDRATLEADIQKINELTGSSESIVKFQDKISTLATSSGLQVTEQTTGERILDVTKNPDGTSSLGVIEIPSLFTMQGKFVDIKSFISELDELDDFLIIGEMELTARNTSQEIVQDQENSVWALEITLIKYQFQDVDEDDAIEKSFINIPLSEKPDQEIINYIRSKQD